MRNKGFTIVEVMIVVCVIAVITVLLFQVVTCGAGATGLQKNSAYESAQSWISKMYPRAKETAITCQGHDTDHNGYVSCTVRVDEQLIPLECATVLLKTMGSECRLSKPNVQLFSN